MVEHSWSDKLDSWFTYSTAKIVVVRDYRLGATYYSALLLIVVYIIYNAIATGSYLDKAVPTAGSVRASAKLSSSITVPDYCTPGPFNPDGCLYWTADQIVFPFSGEANSIFISTRVSISSTGPPAAGCDSFINSTLVGCRAPTTAALVKKVYYVANVEDLTFQLDHSIRYQNTLAYGSTSGLQTVSSQNMKGSLLKGCTGNPGDSLIDMDDAFRARMRATYNTSLDVVTFGQLMTSAYCGKRTFSMNDISDADGAKPGESLRSSGFIVSMPIFYQNRQDLSSVDSLKYRYIPAIVAGSEMKLFQTIQNADGSMTYVDRHGIRVIFAQTGTVGTFNFLALVLNLVAALALIKVASLVVDTLMVYFLPRSY